MPRTTEVGPAAFSQPLGDEPTRQGGQAPWFQAIARDRPHTEGWRPPTGWIRRRTDFTQPVKIETRQPPPRASLLYLGGLVASTLLLASAVAWMVLA